MRLLSEPTAAVMAAGFHDQADEKNVVVFDFGGGTFDISVLVVDNGVIGVEAIGGDMQLGGRDLDQRLVDYCIK